MHSFPNWICAACVLAERSRSASQVSGHCARIESLLQMAPPTEVTVQARPSPRTRASSRPTTNRSFYNYDVSRMARTVAL
eukprot:2166317-Pleurochrysis_carterae.AAC.1